MILPCRSLIHCTFGLQLSPYKDSGFLDQPIFGVHPDRIGIRFHSSSYDGIDGT